MAFFFTLSIFLPLKPSLLDASALAGTVFRMTPGGVLSIMMSFGTPSVPFGANPAQPMGGLLLASDGNFYGTTYRGGDNDFGTVFKMSPSGTWTRMASFNGANGRYPRDRLCQGRDGNFYGTTLEGGSRNGATVFKMTPGGLLTTLVPILGNKLINYGLGFTSTLIMGRDGNIYGNSTEGGAGSGGTIFRFTNVGRPLLNLSRSIQNTQISWQLPVGDFILEESSDVSSTSFWSTTTQLTSTNAGVVSVIVPASTGSKFFRLKQ